jgi:DNA-binding NtrC family response regulator
MTTVLVVDDETGIRELLTEILNDEGYNVDAAENAQQARQYRQKSRPDLVLLDIWMPDIDGISLLREWQTTQQLDMPVLMMSGHATIESALEATRIGAVGYLEKPISMAKLLKSIEVSLNTPFKPVTTIQEPEVHIEDEQPWELLFEMSLRDARDCFEKKYFEYHLLKTHGSMTKLAQVTGLERTHLYRKFKQLGIHTSKKERLASNNM